MNKKAVSDIVLALLLIGALAFSVQRVEAEPTTITVPEDYLTIKEAVNGASSGDTIVVSRGHYAEGQVNVTKPLRSIAHGKVIVDGLHTAKSVFCVRSDKVVIEGFIVKNAREAGIYLSSADNCRIEQNTVTNNYWGISMADSSLNIIRGNKALNNRLGISVFFSECGDFVGRNIFEGNVVENNSGGIGFTGSDYNIIKSNMIRHNHLLGIALYYSDSNLIKENKVTNNGQWGIVL